MFYPCFFVRSAESNKMADKDPDRFVRLRELAEIQRDAYSRGLPIPAQLPADWRPSSDSADDVTPSAQIRATFFDKERGTVSSAVSTATADSKKYSVLKGLVLGQIEMAPVRLVNLPSFPLLDGQIYVRIMSINDKFAIDEAIRTENANSANDWRLFTPRIVAETVIRSACDADGDLIFSAADLPMFLSVKADRRFLEAVWRASFDFNDIFDRAVRATVKNSERTPVSLESSDSVGSGVALSDQASKDWDAQAEQAEQLEQDRRAASEPLLS